MPLSYYDLLKSVYACSHAIRKSWIIGSTLETSLVSLALSQKCFVLTPYILLLLQTTLHLCRCVLSFSVPQIGRTMEIMLYYILSITPLLKTIALLILYILVFIIEYVLQ